MKRENEALDAEVTAMDSRARVIKASVDSKVAAVDALVGVAEKNLLAMGGAGSGSGSSNTGAVETETATKTPGRSGSAKKGR